MIGWLAEGRPRSALPDGFHDGLCGFAGILEGYARSVGVHADVFRPEALHHLALRHLGQRLVPRVNHLSAAAPLACRDERIAERGRITFGVLELPQHVDVVEVAGPRVARAARDHRLQLLGEHGLERVAHQADAAVIEQERVLVFDRVGRDPVPSGDVDRQRHLHGRVPGEQVHADARVVVGLADVLRADELDLPVVVGLRGGYLPERRLGRLVGQLEAPHRRVEVHRGPHRDAHERRDELRPSRPRARATAS